jgi:hypothetical protein
MFFNEINKDSDFIDEIYEEEKGKKYSVNYKKFPNNKDFLIKINTKLNVERRNLNEHFEPLGFCCVMFFDFIPLLNLNGEKDFDIVNDRYESVAQLKKPRYTFTAEIYAKTEKKSEPVKIISLADCRGHDTEKEYEDYIDWFCSKVQHELKRCVFLAVLEK